MKASKSIVWALVLLVLMLATPIYALTQQNNEAKRSQLLKDLRSEDRRVRRKAAEDLARLGDEQTVPALILTLHDPDPFVSAASALTLGEIKDKRAVQPLIELLRSSNAEVRGAAAIGLGRIGDAKAVQPLLPLLNDAETYPRASTVSALGRIGDNSIIPIITLTLAKDMDAQVRTAAAESLGRLGDKQATESLVKALKDPNNYVRTASAVALGQTGGEQATLALIESLKDTDRLVRSAAAESLGRNNDLRAVRPLIEALGDPDQFVRTNAAYSLGRLGDRQAVEALMDAVHLDDNRVKIRAIDSLGAIADNRALPILIDTLQDKDRAARSNSATALGKIADKRAVEPLIRALADPDGNTRRSSVEALTRIGDDRAFEPIAGLIKNDIDQGVRASAINSATKLGGAKAIEPILEVFQGKSLELRNLAAIALGQMRSPEATKAILGLMAQVDLANMSNLRPALSLFFKEAGDDGRSQLKAALVDQDLATRQRALLLTAILADANSGESLIKALKDPSSEMRALAALLLGRSHNLQAVTALRQALADSDESVKFRAGEALALMGVPKYEPPKVISNSNELAKLDNPNSNADKNLIVNTEPTNAPQPPPALLPKTNNISITSNNSNNNNVPITIADASTSTIAQPPVQPSQVNNSEATKDLTATNNNSSSVVSKTSEPVSPQTKPTITLPSISARVNEKIGETTASKPINKPTTEPTLTKIDPVITKPANTNEATNNNQVARLEDVKPEIAKPTFPTPKLNLAAKNETAIINLLQKLLKEQNLYADRNGNYASLETLVAEANLEQELASGETNGYELTLYVSQATSKRPAKFFIIANPTKYGESGERSFFMDESGVVRTNPANTAIQVGQVYGSWNRIDN